VLSLINLVTHQEPRQMGLASHACTSRVQAWLANCGFSLYTSPINWRFPKAKTCVGVAETQMCTPARAAAARKSEEPAIQAGP
jgi:hypothetical protein